MTHTVGHFLCRYRCHSVVAGRDSSTGIISTSACRSCITISMSVELLIFYIHPLQQHINLSVLTLRLNEILYNDTRVLDSYQYCIAGLSGYHSYQG
mmetsp:Transcript_59076/g.66100  ORF Transcript_59076/g.66100 Transcript_59076/m.66100 type:complete len:96 (+) Transcript_59076:130-417(+)